MTRAERMKLTLLGRMAVEDVPFERYISAGAVFRADAGELRRLHNALAVAYTRFHAALNRGDLSGCSTLDDPPYHDPRKPCSLERMVRRTLTNGEVMDDVDRRLERERGEAARAARRANPACVAADARTAQAAKDARAAEAKSAATLRRLDGLEAEVRQAREDANDLRRAVGTVHMEMFPPPPPTVPENYLASVNMQGRFGCNIDDDGDAHYETPDGVRVIDRGMSGRLEYESGAPFRHPRWAVR